PPLSCRTSPPRVGRSAVASAFANLLGCKMGGRTEAADLPPCGGDVRQDRGARDRVPAFALTPPPPAIPLPSPPRSPHRCAPARWRPPCPGGNGGRRRDAARSRAVIPSPPPA